MKWMIASDIHGSEYYCRKMLEAFYDEKADRLLLLGDILYHGPRNDLPRDYNPKRVIELLNGIPVSYTHLDVYKRQVLPSVLRLSVSTGIR